MKKLIKIVFLIISILSFFILFNESKTNNIDNIKNVERTINNTYKILIPNEVTNRRQEDIYIGMKNILDKYNANMYYSRVSESNGVDIDEKYVYINNSNYFNELKLIEGNGFNQENKESEMFLSTKITEDDKQIAQIACLDKNYIMYIYTLQQLSNNGFLFDGYCYVQLDENEKIDNFIRDLEYEIDVDGIKVVEDSYYEEYSVNIKWVIIIALYILNMLILLYYILKSYKKISIKKMLGFTNINIYIKDVGELVFSQIVIQILTTFILGIINFNKYNYYVSEFLSKLLILFGIEIIILFIFISLPYLYLNKIKIINMIKNKQPTKEILIFNTIVKSILILIFFYMLKYAMLDLSSVNKIYTTNSFEKWEEMKDYVILPSTYNLPYKELLNDEESFYSDNKEIYKYFNERGAILADFSLFIDSDREYYENERPNFYERDIVTVNQNYLNLNPVIDTYGNKVEVDESNENTIVLVPEKYKSYENEIINIQEKWSGKAVDLIWIKSGQRLFSYNLDVNNKEGNFVEDVIINVLTENNGQKFDYMMIMAYKGNPFKIKLDTSISIDDNVRPILREFGYSQYITEIYNVSDVVASEMKDLKNKVYFYIVNILIISIALLLVIIQNVTNYFSQYKQYLAIRYLNGYNIWDKYKEYMILILLSWLIIFSITRALNILDIILQIKISVILLLLEIIISIIFLVKNNNKNISSIIKGS